MEKQNYKPLGDNVLIELIHDDEPVGIQLLESSKKVSNKGKIIAIGEDVSEVKKGQTVIVRNRAGAIIGDDEDRIVVSEEDILVIVD